jgi:AraC-like DNA-binding protein
VTLHEMDGKRPNGFEPGGGYITECIDTRREPGDALGYWIEHTRALHGSVQVRFADTPVFRGGTLVQRNADHQLVDSWSDAVHYSRTDADIRADGQLGNVLFVLRRGLLDVEQGGDRIRLRPGHGVLVTKSNAVQLGHDSWARGWMFDTGHARWLGAFGRGPVVMDLRRGLGSVVRTMISTVSVQHRSLDSYEFARACSTIDDLLYACMPDGGGVPDNLFSVERAVRDYVARHAYDPDLNPHRVARSLGWSLRQVQLALQRAGTTTSDLIRSTRLARGAELLRLSSPGTTIANIAVASGFHSAVTFQAAFKRQFGLTPSDARMMTRNRAGSAPGPLHVA